MVTAFARKQFSGNGNFTVAMVEMHNWKWSIEVRPSHLTIYRKEIYSQQLYSQHRFKTLIVLCFKAVLRLKVRKRNNHELESTRQTGSVDLYKRSARAKPQVSILNTAMRVEQSFFSKRRTTRWQGLNPDLQIRSSRCWSLGYHVFKMNCKCTPRKEVPRGRLLFRIT